MTQRTVAVIGNIGIDTNVYLPGADVDFSVESNFTTNLDCVGQAGGCSTRGYARLGCETAFIGSVGEDPCGHWIRETLEDDGVDTSGLFIDPRGTCRSINLMYRDGRRRNFYDGKGHMELEVDVARCRSILAGARLAHFHIPNWARHLLGVARECGCTIACDLQDVTDPHDPYRRDFIEAADVLFFSAANYDDPAPVIGVLRGYNPGALMVIGMGARGCMSVSKSETRHHSPVELPAPVINTNGAGDSLAVGFLTSHVLEGRDVEESVRRGQIAARHCCTLMDNSTGLITCEELEGYALL